MHRLRERRSKEVNLGANPALLPSHPCLVGAVGQHLDRIWVSNEGVRLDLGFNGPSPNVMAALGMMDGSRSIAALSSEASLDPSVVLQLVAALDQYGLVLEGESAAARAGVDVLLELEDFAARLLHKSLYRNTFWRVIQGPADEIPLPVFYGTVLENYHFLFRESWFDSPVLSFPYSDRARVLVNEFYVEELGHDELLLRSLQAIGLTRDDVADTMPTPQTFGLCNALAHWARTDPLFFFTTLGILEGKDLKVDSFIEACRRRGLGPSFIEPLEKHAEINLRGEHGNLTRALFREVQGIDDLTVARLRRLTRVFVELYSDFYQGIWSYYSLSQDFIPRRLSEV